MKEYQYITIIEQYISQIYNEFRLKNYNRKLKEYLIMNHVRGDWKTLMIPITAKIYAGTNLCLGGGSNIK